MKLELVSTVYAKGAAKKIVKHLTFRPTQV